MGNKKNIAYGIMIKQSICEKYDLEIDTQTKAWFEAFYEQSFADKVQEDISKIMKAIPRKRPKRFVDKRIKGGCVDFYLTYNKTMSINKCKKYAPINELGQLGVKSFVAKYADILPYEVVTKDDIKKLYANKEFLSAVIPRWIDSFLECDYNVFLQEKSIKVIKRNSKNIVISPKKISISKSQGYPHISYDGISIIEIAYIRTTPNIRINIDNIELFIERTTKEDCKAVRGKLGNVTEKAICEIYHLKNNINCANDDLMRRIIPYVKNAFEIYNIEPIKYLGGVKGEDNISKKINYHKNRQYFYDAIKGFGNKLNSPIDFLAENNCLISVKTTKSSSVLVCPDTIGQPTANTCTMIMKRFLSNFQGDITPDSFVDIIMDLDNLVILIKKYIEYLFLCDYILYLHEKNGIVQECRLISRKDEAKKIINFKWQKECFQYEKSKEKMKYDLNYSETSNGHATLPINYNEYRIGQFDIHKHHGKYIYQFRFNMKNLLKFFNI